MNPLKYLEQSGDPGLIPWLVTVGYVIAAVLFVTAFQRARSRAERGRSAAPVWASFAVAAGLLGLNKQLDFQLVLTGMGREASQAQGWYQQRGIVQAAFLALVVLVVLGFCVWVLWAGRHSFRETLPAATGMLIIMIFVLMRAASFDVRTTDLVVAGYRATWLLEPIGLLVSIIGTFRWLRRA